MARGSDMSGKIERVFFKGKRTLKSSPCGGSLRNSRFPSYVTAHKKAPALTGAFPFMPDESSELFSQLRQDLEKIADKADVRHLEDGGLLVLVDGDDRL